MLRRARDAGLCRVVGEAKRARDAAQRPGSSLTGCLSTYRQPTAGCGALRTPFALDQAESFCHSSSQAALVRASRPQEGTRRVQLVREGGTRRVQLVREGGGGIQRKWLRGAHRADRRLQQRDLAEPCAGPERVDHRPTHREEPRVNNARPPSPHDAPRRRDAHRQRAVERGQGERWWWWWWRNNTLFIPRGV